MKAILKEDIDEVMSVWSYCGFPITEREIFEILEGRA